MSRQYIISKAGSSRLGGSTPGADIEVAVTRFQEKKWPQGRSPISVVAEDRLRQWNRGSCGTDNPRPEDGRGIVHIYIYTGSHHTQPSRLCLHLQVGVGASLLDPDR